MRFRLAAEQQLDGLAILKWQQGKFTTEHSVTLQVRDLHEHYGTVFQQDTIPRFLGNRDVQLPWPLWDTTKWHDVQQLDVAKLVYRARKQPTAEGQQMLVKFTQQRYGTATHKAWAAAGLVPQLVDEPIKLPGGWLQIQMEYLSPNIEQGVSGWLTLSYLLKRPPLLTKHLEKLLPSPRARQSLIPRARQLLEAAHSQLVDGRAAAHGDARPDNILVLMRQGEIVDLKLIDLDWAGLVGEAKYPILLNTKAIQWPEGVEAGAPLSQAHDLQLLDLQVSPATSGGKRDWRVLTPNLISSQLSEGMDIE